MSQLGAYPIYREPWGTCGTCGLGFPVRFLKLHYRFGWQCTRGNPWGTDCWAAGPHRDEIRPPYYPAEGARKTAAPLVAANEGIDPDAPPLYSFYLYNQSAPQDVYLVTLLPESWNFTPSGKTRQELAGAAWGGLSINNSQEWTLFIRDNPEWGEPVLYYDRRPMPGTVVDWRGSFFFVDANQILNYFPPEAA